MQIAAALSDSTTGYIWDIELENTVNEVAYKVINLIDMTHTKRHILKLKNSVVSGF